MSSAALYRAVQRRRQPRRCAGCSSSSPLFLVLYAFLFPGPVQRRRRLQVHPELVPAGAGRDGAGDAHADRRHQPGDRRDGQPRRGDRGDDMRDRSACAGGVAGGGRDRARRSAPAPGAIVVAAPAAGDHRDAGRLLHHRRRGAADPAAAGRRHSGLAVGAARRQHAGGAAAAGRCWRSAGSSIWRRRSASASTPPARIRSAPTAPACRSTPRAIAAYAISGLLAAWPGSSSRRRPARAIR